MNHLAPSWWARLRSALARRGALGTMRRAFFVLRRRMIPNWQPIHPFDAEHGVATSGLLTQVDLQSGHEHDMQTTAYYGTQPSTFLSGLKHWCTAIAESGMGFEDFTFVDIGCGKGRVLMLAGDFPFRRIVGVELNAAVAEVARENIRRWSLRRNAYQHIEVLTEDVLSFALPPEPVLLYMYNPFEGELFTRWVQKLSFAIRERKTPLYLLYTYPRYEEALRLLPGATLLWTGEVPLERSEIVTDLFGCLGEQVSVYQLLAPESSTMP